MSNIYTIEELAVMLKISEQQVYKLTSTKQISYFTVGKAKGIRFTEQQIQDFINNRNRKSKREIAREAVAYCAKKRQTA